MLSTKSFPQSVDIPVENPVDFGQLAEFDGFLQKNLWKTLLKLWITQPFSTF